MLRLIEAYRNIHAKKKAQTDLLESEARLQSVLDGSLSVIYVKDLESRYLMINRRFEELFHLQRDRVVGLTDFDFFPSDIAVEFQRNDQAALRSPKPLIFEEIAPHPDGPHVYLSNKFAFRNAKGEPYAVCGISTDITEHKHREAELQNREERVRRVLETLPTGSIHNR